MAVALRFMSCLFLALWYLRTHSLDTVPSGFHEQVSSRAAVSAVWVFSTPSVPSGVNDILYISSQTRLWSSLPNVCSLMLLLTPCFPNIASFLVSEPFHLLSNSTYLILPGRNTDMHYLVARMHSGKWNACLILSLCECHRACFHACRWHSLLHYTWAMWHVPMGP